MSERFSDKLRNHLIPDTLGRLGSSDPAVLIASKFAVEVGIKPDGIPSYASLIRSIRRKERVNLSDFSDILNGYKLEVADLDELKEVCAKGALWVSNYPKDKGPMNNFWTSVLSAGEIKNATGKEICWVQSYGDKYHGYNAFIGAMHRLVQTSVGGIMVGDPKEPKIKAISQIFDKLHSGEIVGLYPEGEPSPVLRRAVARSGHLILMTAKKDKPTVAAALYKENDILHLNTKIVQPAIIIQLSQLLKGSQNINQEVVDLVMRAVSSQLPQEMRGYYSGDQKQL